ncbi:MAG TPA: TonB-dependent receptor, partial [Blastocatellia bacterium]
TVTDEQGAVVSNASVTVTSKATGEVRKVTANEAGEYSVENLLPGQYDVKVEATGFSAVSTSITVLVGNASAGDFQLRAGGGNIVVDITSAAPIIDKSDYKIDGVVERDEIDALPLNGRNFLQLALLEPGVSVSAKNPGSQNNLFNVSIGGGDSALTRLTVDGGSIVDPVCGGAAQNFSTETVQEFQISTFNFDLSTGITSVGAINIISRTGTNQFHGSGFIFVRDHTFAANPNLEPEATSPYFRRYQYGGSFGGPIIKDRFWFFGNVEKLDQHSAVGNSIQYSGSPIVAQALDQFQGVTQSPYTGILGNVRADYKLSDKNSLFMRYSRDDNSTFAPDSTNSLPSNWRTNSSVDDNVQIGWTSLPKSNVVNDLRFNVQHIWNNESIPTASQCPPTNLGCIGLGGPEVLMLNSNLQFGDDPNAFQARNLLRYETTDNVSWQRGSHRLKFGGEWEHNWGDGHWAFLNPAAYELFDPTTVAEVDGLIASISALPTSVKQELTIPIPTAFFTPGATLTAQDFQNLPIIAGDVGIGNPEQPPPFNRGIAEQSNRYRGYGQDQWQIRPGFTFSYGAAYDFETNLQNYDLAKGQFLEPLLGTTGKPSKYHGDLAPSAGFAWDVGNKGKTVIRGGAGMYYDTVLFVTRLTERAIIGPAGNGRSELPTAFFTNPFPFIQIPGLGPLSLINPAIGTKINFTQIPTKITGGDFLTILNDETSSLLSELAADGAAGDTGVAAVKTGSGALVNGLQVPYTEQFTVGVQRQLKNNLALSADFAYRHNLHGLMETDYNLFNRFKTVAGSVVNDPIIPLCSGNVAANPAEFP